MASTINQSGLCLFLLFVLLPDFISSIPLPPCYGTNQSKDRISLHFSFFDEYGDAASALHDGGGLNLSCRHRNKQSSVFQECHNWFLHFYLNNSKLTTRNITESYLDFNQYSNQKEKKEMDEVYNGKYSLGCSCCSVEEEGVGRLHIEGKICHPLKGKVCSTDGVCLEKNGEKTCERNSLLQENGAQFTSETGYKLCFGNKIRGNTWAPEYKQLDKNIGIWPKLGTVKAHHCTDSNHHEKREYPRARLSYRHFLALDKAKYLLNATMELREQFCNTNNRVFSCNMKILTGDSTVAKFVDLGGDCKKGWTLDVDEVWNASKAKFECFTYLEKEGDFSARWLFLALPFVAKVRERKDGKGKECVWPGWLEKEPSDLVGDECRDESGNPVQLTVSYPLPQAGNVLTFKTLFPEETTTPSSSTEAPTERPSRVPRWLRVLPFVFLVVGVVQALPFLLYYGYWEGISWLHRRERRREEKAQRRKEQQEQWAAEARARKIQEMRNPRRFTRPCL